MYVAIFLVAIGGLAAYRFWSQKPEVVVETPATTTATAPATTTAPTPTTAPKPPKKLVDLLDIVRADHPDYPTTQPLDLPSDVQDAAKIVVDRPNYLDPAGRLWITHPEGQAIDDLLKKPFKQWTLLVQEQPVCATYPLDGGQPTVITREGGDAYVLHAPRRAPVKMNLSSLRWESAAPLGDRLLVPSDGGAMWIALAANQPVVPPIALRYDQNDHTPAVIVNTGVTALIWSPWENDKPGSHGAIFVDAKRQLTLDSSNGWFDKIVQLVPLADGSILAIGRTDTGIELKLNTIDKPREQTPAEVERITALAKKLGDDDPRIREATQRELESIGPSSHTVLEKLHDSLSPEAQLRIENLLGQQFAPTLAGLHPQEGVVQTVARFRDGGCVLLLTGGGIYEENGQDIALNPAWISIRPGRYIERLEGDMVSNFNVGKQQMVAFGNEWVVVDSVLGPRRVLGPRMLTLLPRDLRHYNQLVGIDASKRWLFTSAREPGKTLILDPSLPDPTPRLPIWKIDAPDGAGWTDTGWPAQKRVVGPDTRIFVLGERGWRLIDEKTEKFQSTAPELTKTAKAPDGRTFELDGQAIKVGDRTLDLPGEARSVESIAFTEDRLFLIGAGFVQRWRFDPESTALPAKPEATFTKGLPTSHTRAWLDPSGRIVFAEDTTLTVAFPPGRVHPDIAKLMLNTVQDEEQKEE
jgi:hypothetical protein